MDQNQIPHIARLTPHDEGQSKLGRAVYLLVQWGREARARQAQQQQEQPDASPKCVRINDHHCTSTDTPVLANNAPTLA